MKRKLFSLGKCQLPAILAQALPKVVQIEGDFRKTWKIQRCSVRKSGFTLRKEHTIEVNIARE